MGVAGVDHTACITDTPHPQIFRFGSFGFPALRFVSNSMLLRSLPAQLLIGVTNASPGLAATRLVDAAAAASAWTAAQRRGFAVDNKHRSEDEMHKYLDSLFCLKDKVALVTGAGGAVGRAVCLALAKCGADVVATDLKKDMCNDTMSAIRAIGRKVEFVPCDVRDRTSVDDAVKEVEKRFGHLEVLIANAGILGQMQLPQDTSEDNWRNIFATNVDGIFHTVRAAYPLLKRSRHGKVVITSSIGGMFGYGQQSAYCASKGALIPLAKSLALAWAPDGINVNVVLPGAINTPFTQAVLNNPEKVAYMKERIPLGRLGEPEDVVGAMVFLSSRAADYVTGATLVVDGGGTSRAMAR